MPRRDGTGPMGEGAITGRGLGTCESTNDQSNPNNQMGYGRGKNCNSGRKGGRGRCCETDQAFKQGQGRGRGQGLRRNSDI